MSYHSAEKRARKGLSLALLIIALLILGAAGAVGVRLFEGTPPKVVLVNKLDFLGSKKTITLVARDAQSGLRALHVDLEQGGKKAVLYDKVIARQGYFAHSGPHLVDVTFQVEPKRLGFADGRAELVVTARDFSWRNWLQGNLTTLTVPVVIDTKPPQITVQNSSGYIQNGGTGVVVYRTNEPLSRTGVTINSHFDPGFPLAGQGENTYVAYVALPFNAKGITNSYVTAVDLAGNKAQAALGLIFRRRVWRRRRIKISDAFLDVKLPAFRLHYHNITGTRGEQFVIINSKIRRENNQEISKFCSKATPQRLWKGAFLRMAHSAREASFADHRTYYYHDKAIDKEVHLGIDLASIRHAEIQAANRGRVVFAGYLGLYGNAIILDHGQGVFSLYGHMSELKVKVGDLVQRGGEIGISGATGMAGGDHLHFGMLVNGIFVNPVQWWDPHWLRLNIEQYLQRSSSTPPARD